MFSPQHSPKSPNKGYHRASSSHSKLKKSTTPTDLSLRFDTNSSITPSQKAMRPHVQDSLKRITSPYRRANTEFSPMSKGSPVGFSATDKLSFSIVMPTKKIRPMSSKKFESMDLSSYYPNEVSPTFPDQEQVETNLKDSLVTLKIVLRECEDKNREKKALLKVVELLRIQTEGMKARKVNFTKNFEKLHKDRLSMNESSISKGNDRAIIKKNSTMAKDGVKMLEKEIQNSIMLNVETTGAIEAEHDAIVRTKMEIAELKKQIPVVTREKEKIRGELQVSSKMLKNMEEKYLALTKEKSSYLHHIGNSNIIKQQQQ